MHPLIPNFLFLLPLLAAAVNPVKPGAWEFYANPKLSLNTPAMSDRSPSLIVASSVLGLPVLSDIVKYCKNAQGVAVAQGDCQYAVLSTGVSMGWSVLSYQSSAYWAGSKGPNGNSKRDVDAADVFFARLPDHLDISNIKVHGSALAPNVSSRSIHRRASSVNDIDVFYNGSLPLTFMIHHEITTDSVQHIIPIFAATDGATMVLSHIVPIPSSPSSSFRKRSGISPYNHVGAGGLKLLVNSDPVATWDDTTFWLNNYNEGPNIRPYDWVLTMAQRGIYVGHSFVNDVHDSTGWGYNGQWGMEGEYHGFGPLFEPDYNWCFGPYETNCP